MPTDSALKQALAKMLPEKLEWWINDRDGAEYLLYKDGLELNVLDTELLHLCWLVEEALNGEGWTEYSAELEQIVNDYTPNYKPEIKATWQQRTIALAKVKGVEVI